jgi:DNA-binding beta-propeller fold protein YncE
MDETSPRDLRAVRELLERATVPEPPIGPMAHNALRAATNTPGKPIRLETIARDIVVTPDGKTAYVVGMLLTVGHETPKIVVTPIATATNTPGKPIKVGCGPIAIAITPDGKTAYVGSRSGAVTPIATATGRPGKPIKVGGDGPEAIVIAP